MMETQSCHISQITLVFHVSDFFFFQERATLGPLTDNKLSFRGVMPCGAVDWHQHFGGNHCGTFTEEDCL